MEGTSNADGTNKTMTVLVTGFGPFNGIDVNTSWEIVRRLPELDWKSHINIATRKVDVEYDFVDKYVPLYWCFLNPDLVVHVGVSTLSNHVVIEKCATNKKYIEDDNMRKPAGDCCVIDGPEYLFTHFDVDRICRAVEKTNCEIKCEASDDCGTYLCGYIYYKSLSIDPLKVLFIHVPFHTDEDTICKLSCVLQIIILEAIDQLNERAQLACCSQR